MCIFFHAAATLLLTRYCTSAQADEILYPYCPKEYREQGYRMQMVTREIREHKADLIMLQVISSASYFLLSSVRAGENYDFLL